MEPAKHWQAVYTEKNARDVSWYRPRLDRSLALIDALGLSAAARILDAGGGASSLVDDLLARGLERPTVVDLAAAALEVSKARLGERASEVTWIVGDVTTRLVAASSLDLWHDRAVFHFLTDPAPRASYVERMTEALRAGGHAVIATFALDGPERCSGLPVARYDADGIARALGPGFEKIAEAREVHETPKGGQQAFTYCVCRKR